MTIYSHMKCPFCYNKTEIYNSRASHKSTQTWRRRTCTSCNKGFTTREKIDWSGQITVREDKQVTPYSRDRLLLSVVRASEDAMLAPEMVIELVDSIEIALQSAFTAQAGIETTTITKTATAILSRHNTHVALRYVQHVYNNKPPLELVRQLMAGDKTIAPKRRS